MKKLLLITAGCTSLSLGIAGIFLPVLPTTPFILLSATCFLNSSDGMYRWITGHRVFGRYIRNYLKYRAVTRTSKVVSISVLWAVILTSAFFFTQTLWLRILLVFIGGAVTVHLALMRTLTREETNGEMHDNA